MIQQKIEKIFKKTLEKKYNTDINTPARFIANKILYNKGLKSLFEVTEDFAHEAVYFKCTGKHLLPNVGFRSASLYGSEKETYGAILDKHFQYIPNDILITYIVFISIIHSINIVPAYDYLELTVPGVKMPSDRFMINKLRQQPFVYRAVIRFIKELSEDPRVYKRDISKLLCPLRYGRVQLVDELQYGVHYLIKERNDQQRYLASLKKQEKYEKSDHKFLASIHSPTIADDNHYMCSKRLPSLFLISHYHFTKPIYDDMAVPMSILDGFWFNVKQENDLVAKINSLENCDFAAWVDRGVFYTNNQDEKVAKQALYNMHRVVLPLQDRIDGYKMLMLKRACKGSPYLDIDPNSLITGRKGLNAYLNREEEILKTKTQKGYM